MEASAWRFPAGGIGKPSAGAAPAGRAPAPSGQAGDWSTHLREPPAN
jgi:hypothetical protein